MDTVHHIRDGETTILAEHGGDDDDTTRFVSNLNAAEAASGTRAETNNESENKTKGEQAALDAVKAYLRRLRLALPRVLRDNASSGVTLNSFGVDDSLRRSTPKTLAYLIKIRSAVETLDVSLKKHFGGKSALAELDAVKVGLEQADTDQESTLAAGPVETQTVHEAMGRLLEDIEDIIRAGKSAFDGQAMIAAKFNKDLILRARRKKKDVVEDDAPVAGR
jgi:hypothetical protein